ncbi:hypothetical protein ACFL59_03180 [Planctomycetota bacterium]
MATSMDEIMDAMYELIKEYTGKKSYTPRELAKAMNEKFGDGTDLKTCKKAVKQIVSTGRLVFTYAGSSYVELPERATRGEN